MKKCPKLASVWLLLLLAASTPAHATMPVVDVAAIKQLLQQLTAWREQLQGMQLQLAQLQQTRAALTGPRGMDQLLRLSLAARNYLPPDWNGVASVLHDGGGAYGALARATRARLESNAILSAVDLSRLAPALQSLIGNERQGVAVTQTLTRAAYAQSSDRFASLSMLIDRIRATPDAKAIAELQGRIEAEQAMLANEGVKLAALAQIADAERAARDLLRRESVVKNHGSFALRFQPVPPVP